MSEEPIMDDGARADLLKMLSGSKVVEPVKESVKEEKPMKIVECNKCHLKFDILSLPEGKEQCPGCKTMVKMVEVEGKSTLSILEECISNRINDEKVVAEANQSVRDSAMKGFSFDLLESLISRRK